MEDQKHNNVLYRKVVTSTSTIVEEYLTDPQFLPSIPPPNILETLPPPNLLANIPPPNIVGNFPPPNILRNIPHPNIVRSVPPPNMVQGIPCSNIVRSVPPSNVVQSIPHPSIVRGNPPMLPTKLPFPTGQDPGLQESQQPLDLSRSTEIANQSCASSMGSGLRGGLRFLTKPPPPPPPLKNVDQPLPKTGGPLCFATDRERSVPLQNEKDGNQSCASDMRSGLCGGLRFLTKPPPPPSKNVDQPKTGGRLSLSFATDKARNVPLHNEKDVNRSPPAGSSSNDCGNPGPSSGEPVARTLPWMLRSRHALVEQQQESTDSDSDFEKPPKQQKVTCSKQSKSDNIVKFIELSSEEEEETDEEVKGKDMKETHCSNDMDKQSSDDEKSFLDDDDCIICFSKFIDGVTYVGRCIPCKHARFCYHCVLQHVLNYNKCPWCAQFSWRAESFLFVM